MTYLKDISIPDVIPFFVALKHLFEELGLLLHLGHLFGCLRSVVRLMSRVIACHHFHESVCFLEVLRSPSSDELLQLG